jgi:hypothetical protein
MRKGFLLIEILMVLFIFMLLAVTFGQLWRTFIFEVPRGYRLVQESSTLNNLVSHIRSDVASARTLSQSTGDSSQAVLLMETPDGVISYKFEQGRILRQKEDDAQNSISWSAPHGKIEWRVRNMGKNGLAVEVITYIEDRDLGHIQKKMANSHLFFTGSVWEAAK